MKKKTKRSNDIAEHLETVLRFLHIPEADAFIGLRLAKQHTPQTMTSCKLTKKAQWREQSAL